MAKRDFNWKTLPGNVGWSLHNAVTDAKLREYVFYDTPSELTGDRQLGLYGGKQLVADKTTAAGASEKTRLASFDKRYNDYRTGAWAFRDGHGTSAVKFPDGLIYRAVVNAGLLVDTADARSAWSAAQPGFRAAQLGKAAVLSEYNKLVPTVDAETEAAFFGNSNS